MSLMTLTATITGGQHPDYYAGRADAYDERNSGTTLHELAHRSTVIADLHSSTQYALGYADRVLELRREHAAQAAAQTDLAHTGATA
ncbi:hypothetical protein [Streptomyces gardneri]|uniref:hypothetical protein n=1 Tax=Streptomyces gardneri TaxID=66892 RepID=UPI0036ABC454